MVSCGKCGACRGGRLQILRTQRVALLQVHVILIESDLSIEAKAEAMQRADGQGARLKWR